MAWVHDELAKRTIAEFVANALPDAHDWESADYLVTTLDGERGRVSRVEVDIPTAAYDCWLSFEIVDTDEFGEPTVLFVHGIRGGVDDPRLTYTCDSIEGNWEPFDEDE